DARPRPAWTGPTRSPPPLVWGDDPFDQRPIVTELGLPQCDERIAARGQSSACLPQIGQARTGDRDQLPVEWHTVGSTPGELDLAGALLSRATMIAPCQIGAANQGVGLLQQAYHDPHGGPQQAAVAWLMDCGCGHRAVQPYDGAVLQLLLPSACRGDGRSCGAGEPLDVSDRRSGTDRG